MLVYPVVFQNTVKRPSTFFPSVCLVDFSIIVETIFGFFLLLCDFFDEKKTQASKKAKTNVKASAANTKHKAKKERKICRTSLV